MTSKALKIMLLVCVFLVIVVSSVQATRDKEGCTPGYWKNHEESWQCYDPNDSFADTFGVTLSNDKTLMQALKTGGGGEKALGRHAVAALLNACETSGVFYRFTTGQVITKVQRSYRDQKLVEEHKDIFEEWNELYCPLD